MTPQGPMCISPPRGQRYPLTYADGQYLLRDVDSRKGTFLREQRLERERAYGLRAGDTIRFGSAAVFKLLIRNAGGARTSRSLMNVRNGNKRDAPFERARHAHVLELN